MSAAPVDYTHGLIPSNDIHHHIQERHNGSIGHEQLAGRKRPLDEIAPSLPIHDGGFGSSIGHGVDLLHTGMLVYSGSPAPLASGHIGAPPTQLPRTNSGNLDAMRANKRDLNWDMQYEALVLFANTYGHCNVRSGYNADTDDRTQINLYAWLALQRRHKKVGRLRKDREEKLQTLVDTGKLAWVGNDSKSEDEDLVQPPPPPPPPWGSYFGALLVFIEDYGHANVPSGHMSFIERRRSLDLGAWVRLQRQLMTNGKLVESHKDKLNMLAHNGLFNWTPSLEPIDNLPESVLEANWNLQFDAVNEYAIKHGHCNVTEPGTVLVTSFGTPFDLSLWVMCQRVRYKLRNLHQSRIERLVTLIEKGYFAWRSPDEARARAEERDKKHKEDDTLWNAWFNVLVWYGRHNGHCNLGATDTVSLPDESEAELGKWLDIQKRYLAKSKLKPDRAEKLRRLVDEQKLPLEWIAEYPQLSREKSRNDPIQALSIDDIIAQSSDQMAVIVGNHQHQNITSHTEV